MLQVKTTCPYCGVGCGLVVSHNDDKTFSVSGDKKHPANFGRLCSKGSALAETLDMENRLLQPVVNGQQCDWDMALDTVADRFQEVIEQHGPEAVAFYVSGQLLTEDYYVANKLMKGFIGSSNIDTNSRLCMSSSVAGHKRAFGSDTVPGCYQDLEQCELLILTGSNMAWCHPVLYQRIVQAKKNNPEMKVVVIDPRRTASCDVADLHLALKPGSDAILFNGLLNWLNEHNHGDAEFIHKHTEGLDEALRVAQWFSPNVEAAAQHCELGTDDVAILYQWFSKTEKTVTVYSQGINQSSSGTDKVNAIINCHLFTGRIGQPGMGPFSVTGQPNAMGGREVGALSNQLAAHMDFDKADIDRVERFWQAPKMATKPGLKAVDLFEALHRGEIKALWVIATNPAVSMPDAYRVRQAMQQCDFLVVSDCATQTDTTALADVLLPALAWGEKSGTVTNSERCISRQRPFLEAPENAKADWWILSQVAQRMGYHGFDYQRPQQIFREHAALSAFENNGTRDFDLSALADIDAESYENFKPTQWPIKTGQQAQARVFGNGEFFTANGRAKFISVTPQPPGRLPDIDYPMVLNTGRVRDQWHTMTRTGKSPRLNGHVIESYAELNKIDAKAMAIYPGQLVEVKSTQGKVIVRASINESQRRGSVFVPMHWNDQFASSAVVDKVVNAYTDPISGQPEFKHTPVQVTPYNAAWYGFILSRDMIETASFSYWARSRRQGLWHYELAGNQMADDWANYARQLLCSDAQGVEWSEFFDSSKQTYRGARFIDGQLDSCAFIGTGYHLPPRDWLIELFSKDIVDRQERMRVLSGTPGVGQEDAGKIVCSCFSVGRNTLCKKIKQMKLTTPEQIGEHLQAGTNCGSCMPELRELIVEVGGG
ncbi:MAG: molybdopterin-dependent oxidoreductase [Gammaproteobacteria bacterium]|nr:molybdopterin-dependent oxidoreductase [Gammaproteobacteria bacterium]